jgi:hypothetical protein
LYGGLLWKQRNLRLEKITPVDFVRKTEENMMIDTLLKEEAMDVLIDRLGEIDPERFISMIKSNTFDYTECQRNLWKGKSIDEIYSMAVLG